MTYKRTTAYKRIKTQASKRIRAIQGGTAASKTVSIIMWLIVLAQNDKEPTLTSVVSESFPHLKRGAIRDFLNIMEAHGFDPDRWNKTNFTYTFPSGSQIEFFSCDVASKVRGPRRQRLFINECNNIDFSIFEQLEVRTEEFIYLDWNPVASFWFEEHLIGIRDDIDHIVLTYKDNEALSEEIVKSIETRKNRPSWWQVYGLGQLGELTNRIFTGWKIIDDIPHEARLERRWLDFGYTNDFTAIGDLYYYNGGYIADELLYQKGLLNKQIADTLSAQPEKALVVADSAEPKSIDEIRSYGVNIVGVAKTKGETRNIGFVKWSISVVQGEKLNVTRRSFNILKEYRNYLWLEDKNGVIQNVEDPKFHNHHMRGIAYAICNLTPIKKRQILQREIGRNLWMNQKPMNPV